MNSSITSVQWDVCKRSGDGRTSLRAKLWMDEEMSPICVIGEEDIAQPLRKLDGPFACLDGPFALLDGTFALLNGTSFQLFKLHGGVFSVTDILSSLEVVFVVGCNFLIRNSLNCCNNSSSVASCNKAAILINVKKKKR